MLSFIFALIFATVMYVFIELDKTYNHVSPKELKRQAQEGDELAKLLYKTVAHGQNLQLVLWVGIVVSAAASVLLFANAAPSIFGFILVMLLLALGFLWLPARRLTPLTSRLAIWFSPPLAWFLYYLHRPLHAINKHLRRQNNSNFHTRLYTPQDLIEFLDCQKSQSNNRILHEDLAAAELALKFNNKTVRDVQLDSKEVSLISANEKLAPLLIDELHATGQTEYLVYDGRKTSIVGLVNLSDLVANVAKDCKIKDLMRQDLVYVHEDFALGEVFQAFHKTKQIAFVVIDSAEKYSGLITLESVLAELAGPLAKSSFENYEDKIAVAHALDAKSTGRELLNPQDPGFESVEVVE